MKTPETGRRRFFGRMTKIAAAIGGFVAAGVVPELRAQTRATQMPPGTATTLEAAPPLPIGTVNALYTQALGDADVALLLASIGEVGRLDPPDRSHDLSLDGTNRAQTVMLPVVSYGTGATLAYVCFGAAISADANGAVASMPIRGLVTATGGVYIAGGGRIAPNPRPENNDIMYAMMFPDQYYQSRVVAPSSAPTAPTMRRTGGGLWDPRDLRQMKQAQQQKQVIKDKRGMCMEQCNITWQSCLNTPLVSTATGGVVGFWCAICLGLATGATIITVGAGAPTLAACITPCAIGAAALAAAALTLANCNSAAQRCFAMCQNIPAGTPI